MRDLVIALQTELQAVEAELVADPRFQKAAKIRELLEIYGTLPASSPISLLPKYDLIPLPRKEKGSGARRIGAAIGLFFARKGTAARARVRLMEVARSDHLANPSSAWLHRQSSSSGHATHESDQLPPLSAVPEIGTLPKLAAG